MTVSLVARRNGVAPSHLFSSAPFGGTAQPDGSRTPLRSRQLSPESSLSSKPRTKRWVTSRRRHRKAPQGCRTPPQPISLRSSPRSFARTPGRPSGPASTGLAPTIDKGALRFPEPRRIRDKAHLKFVAKQPCLICGRRPSDAHHLRFTQPRALGRKVSDEFTVPLCRSHHREVHRCGDESAWWQRAGSTPKCRRLSFGTKHAAFRKRRQNRKG